MRMRLAWEVISDGDRVVGVKIRAFGDTGNRRVECGRRDTVGIG